MNFQATQPIWKPDRLAYWYFRLNGFLTTENFVIHPDEGREQRTDVDLMGVRFMHRCEIVYNPMVDDPRVADCVTPVNVIIAEVKTARCALNGPWVNPHAGNMQRVLRAIGCILEQHIDAAADQLREVGAYSEGDVTVRLFALGERRNRRLPIPPEQQIIWSEMIQFVTSRFKAYSVEKASVGQWSEDGQQLRRLALSRGGEARIRALFGLRPIRCPVARRATR